MARKPISTTTADFDLFIAKIRTELLLTQPFFGTLVMYLTPVRVDDTSGIWLAAVDGTHLYVNHANVQKLSRAQQIFLFAHEAMHCALDHLSRIQARDKDTWLYACDAVINNLLIENKLAFIPGGVHRPEFSGMSAEDVYARLQTHCDAGSSKDEDTFVDDKFHDLRPAVDKEALPSKEEWEKRIISAATIAKQRGTLPHGVDEFIATIVTPKVDWRGILRQFLTPTYYGAPRWATPDRRFVANSVYLPSATRAQSDYVVVAVDTSGSVTDAELNQFFTEIRDIQQSFTIERIRVIGCDAQIRTDESFSPNEPITFRTTNRGGTYYDPVFEHIADENEDPRVLVYLTDGECSCDLPAPMYPVLWVCTRPTPPDVNFGDVTYIN